MIRYEWVDGDHRAVRKYDEDGITRVSVWVADGTDEAHSEVIAFREWVAEGNTPEPWPPAE
jgi:hypothetical protein